MTLVDRERLWLWLGLPLAFFAATEALMLLAALGAGQPPLQSTTWSHWDSFHYLEITNRGYELYDCGSRGLGPAGTTCGNASWFPGLSWATQLAGLVGVPAQPAMLLLSRGFALATLVLVWVGLLDCRRTPQAYAGLGFAAFCPGALYFHALFPMSMATCFMVAALVCVRRERFALAGVMALVAATTYTTVWVFGGLLAAWLLVDAGAAPWRGRLRRALPVAAGTAAGYGLVVLVMRIQTGYWDAFQRNQAQNTYVKRFPLVQLYNRVRPLWQGHVGSEALSAAQILAVAVLILVVVIWAVARRPSGLDRFLVGYAVVVWAIPLTVGQFSLWRGDTLLLPLAPVIARLPLRVSATVVAVAVVFAGPMAAAYVANALT